MKPKKYNSINNTIIKCIKRGGENMGIRFYRTKKIQKKEKTKISKKLNRKKKNYKERGIHKMKYKNTIQPFSHYEA